MILSEEKGKKNAFPSAIGVTAYLSNADCKWQTKHEPENEQKKHLAKDVTKIRRRCAGRTLSVVQNKRACALNQNTSSSPAEKVFHSPYPQHEIDVVS